MTDNHTANRSKIMMGQFRADDWLTRWTDAGGGYAAGSGAAHLVRPPCQCAALDLLAIEIADPDRREALAEHIRSMQ
ncbi:hypothetical protein [Sphingorhabdus contaminans]|uniref:Uncharacterized protein n=1 Tax=Sphingorhabdus contaminans TaxID=1343899 RepID=A0A553WH14_9SPHN|nr:hypothetical protein [Sphingorhabdus contaminans]TSB03972.1 hypothetical protein FOM92_00555 [Sphingorhabdus contaminans]